MSYRDLVAKGVALAQQQTASLQATVQYEAWTGQDGLGAPTYAVPVAYAALVEKKTRFVRSFDGREVVSDCTVTFLEPLALNPQDRLTLPDGSTPAILSLSGMVDPLASPAGTAYLTVVALGSMAR